MPFLCPCLTLADHICHNRRWNPREGNDDHLRTSKFKTPFKPRPIPCPFGELIKGGPKEGVYIARRLPTEELLLLKKIPKRFQETNGLQIADIKIAFKSFWLQRTLCQWSRLCTSQGGYTILASTWLSDCLSDCPLINQVCP